eukprot:366408-Chlamydomonas_euryale.AAC.6
MLVCRQRLRAGRACVESSLSGAHACVPPALVWRHACVPPTLACRSRLCGVELEWRPCLCGAHAHTGKIALDNPKAHLIDSSPAEEEKDEKKAN